MAVPKSKKANKNFISNIHCPVLGIKKLKELPTIISGAPIPSPKKNKVTKPSVIEFVCSMKARAAARGGVTQGVATKAEMLPMPAAVKNGPDHRAFEYSIILLLNLFKEEKLKSSNVITDIKTKNRIKNNIISS